MRKGWDNLTDAYRARLARRGITEADYTSGVPLHGARGHKSPTAEAFQRSSARFARESTKFDKTVPASTVRKRIRAMGSVKGTAYIQQRREMIRLYQSGDTAKAHQLWEHRDTSLPEYMHWYHGIFAY